ncbi:MAG: hypothetical protein ACR2IV_05435 [Bryobacteraceae bacterium]
MANAIIDKNASRPGKANYADGKPGLDPVWSSGAKTIVGTAACEQSRVWYTVGNGVLNEIYFPDIDQANTRSVRFLVSDGEQFFSDEEWDAEHRVEWLEEGAPACRIRSRCRSGRYILEKEIFSHPVRNVLIVRARFCPSIGESALKLYLVVEPHICGQGGENEGWISQYKGEPMMFAQRDRTCMAVALAPPILHATCGYAGKSDGYASLSMHRPLPESNTAPCGNVALTAEVNYAPTEGVFAACIGFGSNPAEAAQQARAGTIEDLDKACSLFKQQWKQKQEEYDDIADISEHALNIYRVSTAVLETHQSKRFAGGFIASLSTPWGFDRSDGDGGYHVLWPRDMVETAMGKLACGDARAARATLFYLACTQ